MNHYEKNNLQALSGLGKFTKEDMLFPRNHQIDVVLKHTADAKVKGAGENEVKTLFTKKIYQQFNDNRS